GFGNRTPPPANRARLILLEEEDPRTSNPCWIANMFLRAPLLQSPPRRCCKNHTTVRGFPAAPANPFGGSTPLRLRRGPEGSNPAPSSGESVANSIWAKAALPMRLLPRLQFRSTAFRRSASGSSLQPSVSR